MALQALGQKGLDLSVCSKKVMEFLSITGDNEGTTEDGSEQLALADPAVFRWVGLDNLQTCLTNTTTL